MTRLLSAELTKLTTVRSTWLVLGLVAAFSAATVAGILALSGTDASPMTLSDPALQAEMLLPSEVALFAMLSGVLIATGDLRHGTIVPTLLAAPSRGRLLVAKAGVAALAAIALVVAAVAANLAVGLPGLALAGEELAVAWGTTASLAGLATVNAMLAGLIGVGVGILLRNQVAAIVAVVVVTFLAGPLLVGLVPEVGWYTPVGLETILLSGSGLLEVSGLEAPFGAVAAGALLAAYAAAATVAGGTLLARRDV